MYNSPLKKEKKKSCYLIGFRNRRSFSDRFFNDFFDFDNIFFNWIFTGMICPYRFIIGRSSLRWKLKFVLKFIFLVYEFKIRKKNHLISFVNRRSFSDRFFNDFFNNDSVYVNRIFSRTMLFIFRVIFRNEILIRKRRFNVSFNKRY